MGCFQRMTLLGCAVILTVVSQIFAQPGGGPDGGRNGRGGGAMVAMRFVPVEQILGFLAFDEKVGLSNEQLVKVKDELKAIHAKRAGILKNFQGSDDREAVMGEVQKLRADMTQKLSAVLKPDQVETLKVYMQQINQRGGPGGQRGGQGGQRGGDGM